MVAKGVRRQGQERASWASFWRPTWEAGFIGQTMRSDARETVKPPKGMKG